MRVFSAAPVRAARTLIKSREAIRGGSVFPDADALLTRTRLRLLDAGYIPVPANGKRPGIAGWPDLATNPPDEAAIESWTRLRRNCRNTGIICGITRVIDLDVDDLTLAAECREVIAGIVGENLPCRVGRWPRVALFARSSDPHRATQRHRFKDGSIEYLGPGAHVVVDGVHPDTRRSYYWLDDALWECLTDLPILTAAHEAAIIDRIAPLLGKSPSRSPASARIDAGSTGILVGWRNNSLFPQIRAVALSAGSEPELVEHAMALNTRLCAVPLDPVEIAAMVRWAWKKKMAGRLYPSGGEARAPITQSEWDATNPDTSRVLTGLRLAHGAERGKVFAMVSKSMAKSFKMGPQRITRARRSLIASGLLEQVGELGHKGRPTRYRLVSRP